MLSNSFWYGFLGGAALVFGILFLVRSLGRRKQGNPPVNPKTQ
jgi:hypothetical protein